LGLDDDDGKVEVGHVEPKIPTEIDTTHVITEPLNPEQPTPDKEFQTVINSAMGKTNIEKAKVDSPEEEAVATPAPDSTNSDTTTAITKNESEKVSETPVKVEPPLPTTNPEDQENETPTVNIVTESETGSP